MVTPVHLTIDHVKFCVKDIDIGVVNVLVPSVGVLDKVMLLRKSVPTFIIHNFLYTTNSIYKRNV